MSILSLYRHCMSAALFTPVFSLARNSYASSSQLAQFKEKPIVLFRFEVKKAISAFQLLTFYINNNLVRLS